MHMPKVGLLPFLGRLGYPGNHSDYLVSIETYLSSVMGKQTSCLGAGIARVPSMRKSNF